MENFTEAATVLHIDRNQLFREGLRRILSDSQFTIEGEAPTIEEGLSQLASLQPHMIIVDSNGYANGALGELIDCTTTKSPKPRVVVLTDNVGMSSLANALDAGTSGYLLKDMSTDALTQSLRLVLMGETVFPTDLAYLLVNNRFMVSRTGVAENGNGGLSGRETEILSCLVNGLANKEIANRLDIAEGTVKVHLKGILKKIGVHNRTQAAIWAVQHDIVADAATPTGVAACEASTALEGFPV
jgi:two-component system, NarL family, nitrate/nitrite response regulator NarL